MLKRPFEFKFWAGTDSIGSPRAMYNDDYLLVASRSLDGSVGIAGQLPRHIEVVIDL